MEDNSSESSISLKSVTDGASIYLGGRIVSNGIGFITNLILTRILGASLYGIFSYVNVVFSLIYIFTRLGGDQAIMRYLPEYEQDTHRQSMILYIAYLTTFVSSILFTILVYKFAPLISKASINEPLFIDVLRVAALVIPFNTLSNITLSVFKSIERMDYNVAVSSIVKPISKLVFIGCAVLLGYSVVGAAAGLVVASMVVFASAIIILLKRTDLAKFRRPSMQSAKEYYNFSLPLTISQVGSIMYKRVDIVMVGIFLTSQAVGIYNISVILSTLIALPLEAFKQLFPPIASRLYVNDKVEELKDTYRVVTRWIFTISLFPGIAAIVYSNEVLRVFGKEFPAGSSVLILFIFAQLTNALVGPSGYVLVMTDHQYLSMMNKILSGILNIILNYILILEYGLIGAAVATAFSLATVNILRVLQVWYLEGMIPYETKYIKPLAAGMVSVVVLYLFTTFLDTYTLLVSGGIVGGFTYIIVLYILGFEQEEKDMFRSIILD